MLPERGRVIGPAAFLFVAILLGGSLQSPLLVLLVQLAAIALLGLSIATLRSDRLPAGSTPAIAFACLVALVPIAQLVPLPGALWASLPGHAFPADVLAAAAAPLASRPLSLSPDGTWRAFLALLPPLAMFVTTLTLSTDARRMLAVVVVAAATISALLGLLQVLGTAGYLYSYSHRGNSTGVFANRNHQADLMLVAALFSAAYSASAPQRLRMRPLAAACVAFFAISAVATTSRAGTALMPLAAMVAAYLLASAGGVRPRLAIVAGGVAIAAVGAAVLMFSPVVQSVLARYQQGNEDRGVIWEGTRTALGRYWPTGSGLGSFQPVYQSAENLDTVGALIPNHAHNEYLELVLETGVVAPVLMLFFIVLVGIRLMSDASSPRAGTLRVCGATAIMLFLLHSTVDYPLRMPALAALFGFCCALLYVPAAPVRNSRRTVSVGHGLTRAAG